MFTCFNRILADDLRKRIPEFFNFMKVEKQIDWENRLWCVHSWGTRSDPNSGAYRYICNFYELPFYTFGNNQNFDSLCRNALEEINKLDPNKEKFAFDYMLIDESQDFGNDFIKLCDRITRKHLFVAGDIFQNIFGLHSDEIIQRDYLLNRCYRTEPKTLIFSHALSMGLIEKKKLQWMNDEQWELCGYKVRKENNNKTYRLSRDSIKRFEELQTEEKSIELIDIDPPTEIPKFESLSTKVVRKIKEIINSNPTITIQDIGVISMTSSLDFNIKLALLIEDQLSTEGINWSVNRVFETKIRPNDSLFLSNLNNVKGLEFPFVICISPKPLNDNLKYRNALYMALTRSFIQTTLLSPPFESSVYTGLDTILRENCIITEKPTDEESKAIEQLNIDFNSQASLSHKDLTV